MTSRVVLTLLVAAIAALAAPGCSTAPKDDAERQRLEGEVDSALASLRTADPSLGGLIDHSAGYAIFPSVGKGGLGVGAAYGKGHVYERGQWVGYSDVRQGTVGLQAGGQTFHELVVFQDQASLDRFKTGQYSLAANASAVALKANAARSAGFRDGVIVFVKPEGGLMVEASIGGQKFSYQPR